MYLEKCICFTYHAVPPTIIVIRQGTLRCRGNVSTVCAIMTGATGYLECSTVGVPTPNVNLTTDAEVSNNVMVNGSRVTVTSAVAENAGNYTCNASNFLDFNEQTFELFVGGKLYSYTQSTSHLALFPGSPRLGGGEPGIFCHMRDIKGRHNLIMRGWTKLGTRTFKHKHFQDYYSRQRYIVGLFVSL